MDKDGTSPNNNVSYELGSHQELFDIDMYSGRVTTKQKFDRETQDKYFVEVRAKDGAPSSLDPTIGPNSASQKFLVSIEDKNDNVPVFANSTYRVENIPENADKGFFVIDVKAYDNDIAFVLIYSITLGNVENAFAIESRTGRITVQNSLDYEKCQNYNLTIVVSDGAYNATAYVFISIDNINDELPIFEPYNKNITNIEEESIPNKCIITLTAYDPDIQDRFAPQNILYRVDAKYQHFLSVNSDGCVKLIGPLDRDKPNGSPTYQAYIYADDENGNINSQSQSAEIFIILDDINDNKPFLTIVSLFCYFCIWEIYHIYY